MPFSRYALMDKPGLQAAVGNLYKYSDEYRQPSVGDSLGPLASGAGKLGAAAGRAIKKSSKGKPGQNPRYNKFKEATYAGKLQPSATGTKGSFTDVDGDGVPDAQTMWQNVKELYGGDVDGHGADEESRLRLNMPVMRGSSNAINSDIAREAIQSLANQADQTSQVNTMADGQRMGGQFSSGGLQSSLGTAEANANDRLKAKTLVGLGGTYRLSL